MFSLHWRPTIFDRYIGVQFLSTCLLVSIVFITLIGLIQIITEIPNISHDYQLRHALWVVSAQVFAMFYDISPIIVMISAILAMGHLASENELIVMQSSGMSTVSMMMSLIKTVALVVFVLMLVGEGALPNFQYRAEKNKAQKLNHGQAVSTAEGTWVRHPNGFVNFSSATGRDAINDVTYYEIDKHWTLKKVMHADHARYYDGNWHLFDVVMTMLTDDGTKVDSSHYLMFDIGVSVKAMQLSSLHPDFQSIPQLIKVIRYRNKQRMETESFRVNLWQRLLQPIETILLSALIIPLLIGPMRDASMGRRLLLGLSLGLGFFYLGHFLAPFALSLEWPFMIAVALPCLLLLLINSILIRWVRVR